MEYYSTIQRNLVIWGNLERPYIIPLICGIYKTKQGENRLKDTDNKPAVARGEGSLWGETVKQIKRYNPLVIK